MTDDAVTLTINGQKWDGWQGVLIQRGIETCPPSFHLALTSKYPSQPPDTDPPQAGAPVVVSIGDTAVITGYADRMVRSMTPRGSEIAVMGRGRCADLVDCSAIADNSQFLNQSLLQIAQRVAAPFGISVIQQDAGTPATVAITAADGMIIQQLNVTLDVSPWNIIEQLCRFATLLCYESAEGNVVLSSVGTQRHASGFRQGLNVQAAAAMSGMDMRYGEYIAVNLSVDTMMQTVPSGGDFGMTANNIAAPPVYDAQALALKKHDGTLRPRKLILVSEQGAAAPELAAQRAKWEAARRWGRGQIVTLTCDSWRDSAGTLWTPNQIARIDLPALGVSGDALIADVAFMVDLARGKVADITLMPPEAFRPAPPPVLPNAVLQLSIKPPAAP